MKKCQMKFVHIFRKANYYRKKQLPCKNRMKNTTQS